MSLQKPPTLLLFGYELASGLPQFVVVCAEARSETCSDASASDKMVRPCDVVCKAVPQMLKADL